jgi:DNA-binding transcriptional LysR family regulator
MDTFANLKTFLAVARTENFSAAARELDVAPSVVTKRIGQLEWKFKAQLFELFAEPSSTRNDVQGLMRIKAPSSVSVRLVGPMLERFQQRYPLLDLEIIALDRAVNPAEEGFDMALTLMPDTYASVIEEPLCPMPRSLCATPKYLAQHEPLTHPRDLLGHSTLNFLPTGNIWLFDSPTGEVKIKVQPRLNTNEAQLLLSAALAGNGVAILGAYLSRPAIEAGTLIPLLQDHPLQGLWLKALVPESRVKVPRVQLLLQFLKAELSDAFSR